jgi:AraC-like DNA-binding protein
MLARIDALCERFGMSRSEVLRRCAEEGLPIVEAILDAEQKARDAARRKALGK